MRGRPQTIPDEVLLDAARDVFREEGHAATTAKIAKRAGVSEGILFYRYKSKEALLAAVIDRETEPPEALRDAAALAGEGTVRENLERTVEALLEAVARAHPFIELAITSPTSGKIHALLFAKGGKPPPQRIAELLAGYLDAEIRLGRVRKVDSAAAARAVIGGCIEQVRSRPAAADRASRRAFARALVDLLVFGLAGPAAPAPSRR